MDLAVHFWSLSQALDDKDPNKKLKAKEKDQFQSTISIVSKSIGRGLILAKYQPELAGAFFEQMNYKRQNSAVDLLNDMLDRYNLSLSCNLANRAKTYNTTDEIEKRFDSIKGCNEPLVEIDSKYIMDFVDDLGISLTVEIYKLDPKKKIKEKDLIKLQDMSEIVSSSIGRGLILAKYQPELAASFFKQVNCEKQGFADELLKKMLSLYKLFIYKKTIELR